MKVVIVAKTRMGSGACIGAMSFDGQSLRLLAPSQVVENGHFNLEYEVGDVWEIDWQQPDEIVPPHVESVVVVSKRKLPPIDDLCRFVLDRMPPRAGGPEALFEGLVSVAPSGAQYVAERSGTPAFSTMFWQPDRTLTRVVDQSVRIRFAYPADDGPRMLTYVGFREAPESIPAGAIVRVSLAHWWRPNDKPDEELRCYVQLSGWYDDCHDAQVSFTRSPGAVAAVSLDRSAPRPSMADAESHLRRVFGFEQLRPAQQTVIDHILHQRDTLAVMPTGSGKSLCYQLPALLFSGLTVVVSPLIALMEDQVLQLRELGIRAGYLNSAQGYQAQVRTMQMVRSGELRLLYAAPETLLKPEVMQLLDDVDVACLAIDEAHCISEWGHDFRPEYRQLGEVRRRLSGAACVALTATATERVRHDIRDNLGMGEAQEVVTSFNRANLYLSAQERQNGRRQLLAFLADHRGESGLIYCLTKADVDSLTADLQAEGLVAIPYHADLDNDTRRAHHRRFVYEEGIIVVATIAFGMGINKPNVRFVVHYGMPKDIETYYQQIGRAGRDGLRADCLLLHSRQDVHNAMYHINKMPGDQKVPAQMRLGEMSGLVETSYCRRKPLLRYFGEVLDGENCGMCDNCLGGPHDTIDLTIPAQKFLSCVRRTGEMFGPAYIIDVLRGSRSARIRSNGHDGLTTYNIGREYSKAQWQSLAQQFTEAGLLRRDMAHGGLSLTAEGWEVLRGKPFHGVAPIGQRLSSAGPRDQGDYDHELFELLRTKRLSLAAEQGVPPFVVAGDRSLQEMASHYPTTESALLAIYGIGEAKAARYGPDFLAIIRAYCQANGIEPTEHAPSGVLATTQATPLSQAKAEVADQFSQGATLEAIAAMRKTQRRTLVKYLDDAVKAGYRFAPEHLYRECGLSESEMTSVLQAFDEYGALFLRPIYEHFGESLDYETLNIVRLIYLNEQNPMERG